MSKNINIEKGTILLDSTKTADFNRIVDFISINSNNAMPYDQRLLLPQGGGNVGDYGVLTQLSYDCNNCDTWKDAWVPEIKYRQHDYEIAVVLDILKPDPVFPSYPFSLAVYGKTLGERHILAKSISPYAVTPLVGHKLLLKCSDNKTFFCDIVHNITLSKMKWEIANGKVL